MFDAMLLPDNLGPFHIDAATFAQRAEDARELTRCRIQCRQMLDSRRCNLRYPEVTYNPGDQVWVWTSVRQRGRSEKLLRRYFRPYTVERRLSDLTYEVLPEGTPRNSLRCPETSCVRIQAETVLLAW